MGVEKVGVEIKNLWIGMILIMLFELKIGWFKDQGFEGWEGGLWNGIRQMFLKELEIEMKIEEIMERVKR